MATGRQKGSAVWESLPLITLLFVIVSGILLVAYLLFGKVFINYQAEQALYCVSEGTPISRCRRQLLGQIERHLPWGTVQVGELRQVKNGVRVQTRWSLDKFHLDVNREMVDFSQLRFSR